MNKTILGLVAIVIIIGAAFAIQGNRGPEHAKDAKDTKDAPAIAHSYSINLSNQGLNNIPAYIFGETQLKELNVSHNLLTGAIPAEIRHLGDLRVLDLSNNQMTGVPAEVGQLQNLEMLNLANNKLTGLPNELGNLKNLQVLNVSGNQYSKQDLDYIASKLPSTVIIIK